MLGSVKLGFHMAHKIPKLQFESKRFVARLFKGSDYKSWCAAYEAMLVKQNDFDEDKKIPKELTRPKFNKFLKKTQQFKKSGDIYHFGVFEKRTGRLMGQVLFALVIRYNVQSARLSYNIFNNYWKHGYGKEVVDAAVKFGFLKMLLHRLELEILPNNRASIGLAKSLGFQYEGIRRGAVYLNHKWMDHAIYAHLAEDYGIKNTKPKIFHK
jgi:ribosomal-protein-alanine N-acetyltransferase